MTQEVRLMPYALRVLEGLNSRIRLETEDKWYHYALKKGYKGELCWDEKIERLRCDCIHLKDLDLKVSRNKFQIDSLLITAHTIYIYEIKNYEGEYILKNGELINYKTRKEIINPAIQVQRTASLLRQLIARMGIRMEVQAYVVYINPGFTLYQEKPQETYLFSSMLNKYLEDLESGKGLLTPKHHDLKEKLIDINKPEHFTDDLPNYTYESLKKGLFCSQCSFEIPEFTGRMCICPNCNYKEQATAAILRHIEDFCILFPEKKLNKRTIVDWCKHIPSNYTVNAILKKNYKVRGGRRFRYYE